MILGDLRDAITFGSCSRVAGGYPNTRSAAPVEMRVSCSTECTLAEIEDGEIAGATLRGKISTTRAIKS